MPNPDPGAAKIPPQDDIYNLRPSKLVLYSTSWCPDCKRSKAFLDSNKVDYLDIDIGNDNDAFIFIEKLTRRVRIPTLFFPDGTILIEPSNDALSSQIGVS
jgi:glutaredoxin